MKNHNNELYSKLYKFIMLHLHHKELYNKDLKITNDMITFSVGNKIFRIDIDNSIDTILDKIEYFIVSNNF